MKIFCENSGKPITDDLSIQLEDDNLNEKEAAMSH
jgi:hypothetical protein